MATPDVPIESVGPTVPRMSIDRPHPTVAPPDRKSVSWATSQRCVDLPMVRCLVMNFQMNHGTWLLLLTLAGSISAELGVAEMPNQVERLGRLYGVCWGDGYHACRSSGFHPLADLPPVDRKAVKAASHHLPRVPRHQRGATFYDRFDAGNRSRFQSAECDSPGCDSVDCDSGSYSDDSYSESAELGSTNVQVIGPEANGAADPVHSAPAKKRAAPFRPAAPVKPAAPVVKPAAPVVKPAAPEKPAEEASWDVQPILMAPLSSRTQPYESHPVWTTNLPNPQTIRNSPAPSYAAQPTESHVVRSSVTPRGINPIYPDSSAAISQAIARPTSLTTVSARPTRIGESRVGPTAVNTPIGRPRVELAERVSASDGEVVRQPSYIK